MEFPTDWRLTLKVPVPFFLVRLHGSSELMLLEVEWRLPTVFVAAFVFGVLTRLILVAVVVGRASCPIVGRVGVVIVDVVLSFQLGVLRPFRPIPEGLAMLLAE